MLQACPRCPTCIKAVPDRRPDPTFLPRGMPAPGCSLLWTKHAVLVLGPDQQLLLLMDCDSTCYGLSKNAQGAGYPGLGSHAPITFLPRGMPTPGCSLLWTEKAVLVLTHDKTVHLMHAGDSACYELCRNAQGASKRCRAATTRPLFCQGVCLPLAAA